ncbi:helix-turn-helix domain-containing protein [Sphaerisporangium rufum]|uniref:helix-turn-helix domain-containing protein n=1 Tax=Sphaerisporangium rufum TaxID=1381558 RepID=UPI001EF2D601|nr:helix-turn-helix transcriptional regulator [Sphaerisporangium rufum]
MAGELARLREAAGLTREQVAHHLDWHATKTWRIENARSGVTTGDLRDLLDLYQVSGPRRDSLIAFARRAREKGWWTEYSDIFTGSYNDLEAQACAIRTFEPLLIPGLLQTEAYARAIVRSGPVIDPAEVKRRVQARMARQQLLTAEEGRPRLWAVIDEAALRRPVGGAETMREQLQRLIDLVDQPHITLQIVKNSVGAHPGLTGPFVVLDFPEPDLFAPVVYLELAPDGLYLEETEAIMRYTLIFDHLRAIAVSPVESSKMLNEIKEGLSDDE